MYKLANFYKEGYTPKFIDLLKSKWDEAHESDVFRYKIDKLEERFVDKYLLLLNSNRQVKRRAPEEMNSVCQPFDKNKFNFTKVAPKEILFSIEDKGHVRSTVWKSSNINDHSISICGSSSSVKAVVRSAHDAFTEVYPVAFCQGVWDKDIHTVLVNVSPISRYHSLLCPSVNKCLPQVVTMESLSLAVEIMFLAQDRDLRLLFNSLCGFASVNHLHYHLFMEKNDFFVENVKWQHFHGSVYRLDENYPIPAFCFEVQRHSIAQSSKDIYKILKHFLKKSIAHNILITSRQRVGGSDNTVKVLLWPRKSANGAKQLTAMNSAVLELSGWFPIYDREAFLNLTAEDLTKELSKWQLEDFDKLCEEIKYL